MRATRLLRAAHGHSHGSGGAYGGFVPPHVNPVHQHFATFIGATMWFWILYRAKEDGGVVLGLWRPWEAHGDHGRDDHGAHGADEHHHHSEVHAEAAPAHALR